ncbi:MAG: tetratricopeptide repeat protein [Candidatus Omnitrophica bacterium]|nr:tetratricopeptide repeat protein [Candidatus Omnitrophota bacterium]
MRVWTLFLALILLVHVAGAQTRRYSAGLYRDYLQGVYAAARGDYETAVRKLEDAKRFDPDAPHLRVRLATYYIKLGQLAKAENELQEVKNLDPRNVDASLALIFLYSYGQKEEALVQEYEDFLTRALKISPKDQEILLHLAQYYFQQQRYEKAEEIYQRMVDENPEYVEGLFWLGYLKEELGNRKKAIRLWRKVLEVDADHAPTLNSLAYIYAEEGIRLAQAESMLKNALAQEPENGAYLDSLGWVYYKQGEYARAEEVLRQAIGLVKDPVIYEHLGDVYRKLDQPHKAAHFYREGLTHFPENERLQRKVNQYGENTVPQE